jgi:hypothetical protein
MIMTVFASIAESSEILSANAPEQAGSMRKSAASGSVALTPKQIVGIQAVRAARLFHHNMLGEKS